MIILTALGTGKYEPATYQWKAFPPRQTQFFSAALKAWHPAAQVKVLSTEGAEQKHGPALREAISGLERIDIPKGQSDQENWELFDQIVAAIPEKEEVLFDITHGFRSLPVVTLLALSFLRVARGVKVQGVVYGAYDQQRPTEEITPVFDLTPFLEMLDWANATKRFIETGDSSRLKPLLEREKKGPLALLAGSLPKLSQALAFTRTREAARLAHDVTQILRQSDQTQWPIQHKPFGLLVESLEQSYAGLGSLDTETPIQQLKTQYAHIEWYCKHKHYDSAITLTREWLVSVVVWRKYGKIDVPTVQRTEAENTLNERHSGDHADQQFKPLRELWNDVGRLRNDIAHCGMRRGEISTEALAAQVKKLIRGIPAACIPFDLTLTP